MKKLIGGIFVLIVVVGFAAGVFFAPIITASVHGSGVKTDTYFWNRQNYFIRSQENDFNGIYFYRTDEKFGDDDVFKGDVYVDSESFIYKDWEFKGVRENDKGAWVDCDWFTVNRSYTGESCDYIFRKNLPAGKYGIKASAVRESGKLDEQGQPEKVPVTENGVLVVSYHIILYGTDLKYISCIDTSGNGFYQVSKRNPLGKSVGIIITTNAGAMDKTLFPPGGIKDDIPMGNFSAPISVSLDNMEITFEKDGKDLGANAFPWSINNGRLWITPPKNLGAGQYTIKLSHTSNDSVFGTYIIDNDSPKGGGTGASGTILLVLGIIAAFGALGLYLSPKLVYVYKEWNYKRLQAKSLRIRSGEAAVAQSAKSSNTNAKKRGKEKVEKVDKEKSKEQTRASGFLAVMHENRLRRRMAHEAGTSMEQIRAEEKKLQDFEEAKKHNFGDIRRAIDEELGLAPPEEKEKPVDKRVVIDGFETELLDSVAKEAAFLDEQFVQEVVQPHINPAATPAESTSILERLRGLTERAPTRLSGPTVQGFGTAQEFENKQTKKDENPEEKSSASTKKPEQAHPSDGAEAAANSPMVSILSKLRKLTGEDN